MRLHLYSYALMARSSLVRTHCVLSGHSHGFLTKLSICRVKGLQIAQPHTVLLEQISVLFSVADRAARERSFAKMFACSDIWILLSSRTAISIALHNCTNRAIVLHWCVHQSLQFKNFTLSRITVFRASSGLSNVLLSHFLWQQFVLFFFTVNFTRFSPMRIVDYLRWRLD